MTIEVSTGLGGRYCVKRVRIRSYSVPHFPVYSVQFRGNADQNSSEYGHFSRSESNISREVSERKDHMVAPIIKEVLLEPNKIFIDNV